MWAAFPVLRLYASAENGLQGTAAPGAAKPSFVGLDIFGAFAHYRNPSIKPKWMDVYTALPDWQSGSLIAGLCTSWKHFPIYVTYIHPSKMEHSFAQNRSSNQFHPTRPFRDEIVVETKKLRVPLGTK
jgi:hypothetical protein